VRRSLAVAAETDLDSSWSAPDVKRVSLARADGENVLTAKATATAIAPPRWRRFLRIILPIQWPDLSSATSPNRATVTAPRVAAPECSPCFTFDIDGVGRCQGSTDSSPFGEPIPQPESVLSSRVGPGVGGCSSVRRSADRELRCQQCQ
jgi:hypothetical protein